MCNPLPRLAIRHLRMDADYYAAAVKRFEAHKAQATLFQPDDYDRVTRDYQESLL